MVSLLAAPGHKSPLDKVYTPAEAAPLTDCAILLSITASMGTEESRGSTVGSIQVADLLEALRRLGADPVALSATVGLSVPSPGDPVVRVPSALLVALVEAAGQQLRDPLVGLHVGARVETRDELFYLLMSTPDLNEGFRLFTHFARVSLDTQEIRITTRAEIVEMAIDPGDPAVNRSHHAVDYIVGANLSVLRRAIHGFRLVDVTLTHEEVGEPGETARTFGCPVRFGCLTNTLRFPRSTLDGAAAGASPAIAEQIRKFTATVFDRVTARDVRGRVANELRSLLLAGLPVGRAAVAKRLHVSERTLQRQLQQEAVGFQSVLDGIRLELSQALLSNRALKVETIARSVGFAEVASFSRAFARWFGCTPTRYRTRLEREGAQQGAGA
jgi:AraC-like DNA-binding protein